MKTVSLVALIVVLGFFGVCLAAPQLHPSSLEQPPATAQKETPEAEVKTDKAVERAKREVKMLDDVYKGGIVLITQNYVNGEEDLPAGTAFKKLFEAAKKKGWHEVRLVDATGDPYSDENVAVSDFEKRAIKELVAGKSFVQETVTENNKRYLLAATPIPVVMEKCTMCHSNYDMDEKGVVIGALTYRMPIDE